MGDEQEGVQEQVDALREQVDAYRVDSEVSRASLDQLQKTGQVDRADIDRLQVGAEVDRHLIAELQADGVLRAEHSAQLEDALRTARVIGAAIGIVIATRHCNQQQAFELLKKMSQDSNRKLRDIADDVVAGGGG